MHLWLPHPSPALWDRIVPHAHDVPRRRKDATADVPHNALLASLGRDSRELQLRTPQARKPSSIITTLPRIHPRCSAGCSSPCRTTRSTRG